MKNHLTLRSTLSSASWSQRGAALLLLAALILTLALGLRPTPHASAPTPAVHQAAPAGVIRSGGSRRGSVGEGANRYLPGATFFQPESGWPRSGGTVY